MAKSSSKSSSKSNVSSKPNAKSQHRSNPMTPKAGYTVSRRRYGTGGKV